MAVKVTFEMDEEDFENLTSIIQAYVVKHKYEASTDDKFTKQEKDWLVRHSDYVKEKILDKILSGATKS